MAGPVRRGERPALRRGSIFPAVCLTGLLALAASAGPARAETLECDAIRRLSDNYLLDLRIRFALSSRDRTYVRSEDVGRGWERIAGTGRFTRQGNDRIVLAGNRFVTSYLEPLTGTYYYIDRSGVTQSVWGHCGLVESVSPLF